MAQSAQRARNSKRRLGRGLGSLISAPIEVQADVQAENQPRIDAQDPTAPESTLTDPPEADAHHDDISAAPAEFAAIDVDTQADRSDTPVQPFTPAESGDRPQPSATPVDGPAVNDAELDVRMLPLADIRPNPTQPRRSFSTESLEQLKDSIVKHGVLQPIVVRPDADGGYEIVAGERRWRAAGRAGLLDIPAVVRPLDDQSTAEWSLIENLQREDLNPMERAEAYQRLIDTHGFTHQMVAERLGQERSSISNYLRLLDLGEFVQEWVRDGELSYGHARTLLPLANNASRTKLARDAIKKGWSVRELERRVRATIESASASSEANGDQVAAEEHAHIRALQAALSEHLGTNVKVVSGRKKGTGKMVIEFFTFAQFEGLLDTMGYSVED